MVLSLSIALAASCSLIVPSEVDPIRCRAEGAVGAPACPDGQQCVLGTCRSCGAAGCIVDAGVEGTLAQPCRPDGNCNTGLFCTDGSALGFAPGVFCSKGCCSSEECGPGVCAPSTGGANVCVPAGMLGRIKGSKERGTSCGAPSDCASGLCENNFCLDVCCRNSDCSSSEGCVLRTLPDLATRVGFLCGPPGGAGDVGSPNCTGGDSCRSRACVATVNPTYCSGPCCKRSECGNTGTMECIYDLELGVRGCKLSGQPEGPTPIGMPCQGNADCQSSLCVDFTPLGKFCSDSCCVDKDCGNPEQLACAPVGTAQKLVLLCVPRQSSVN